MRLLQREPEAPSLETWLSRDVPHERKMAGELLDKMGREKALAALLAIHDREEAKREKKRKAILKTHFTVSGIACLAFILTAIKPLNLMPLGDAVYLTAAVFAMGALVSLALQSRQQWNSFHDPLRQNTITALFDYADNPRVADPLCRALPYYHSGQQHGPWILFEHVQRILPVLPADKDTLSKEARDNLRSRLEPIETGGTADITPQQVADRAFYANFQVTVLHYFARTHDKKALSAIRKLAKAKTYSVDGVRVRDAARLACQSLSNTVP